MGVPLKTLKLPILKAVLVTLAVTSVTLGVLWGGVEKAYYVFEGDNIKAFLKINSWEEANLNLNVEAKGWQDQAVEGNITLKVLKEGFQLETYSFNGSGWQNKDYDDGSYDYQTAKLKTGVLSFPAIKSLPESNYIQHVYVKACLRLKGDNENNQNCAERAYSKNQLVKNAATSQETLKSNSIALSNALAIGVVDYAPSTKAQKISFEINLASTRDVAESFSLFPEYTGKVLDFSKVKISVFSKSNPAMPMIQVSNGVIKQTLLFSMGQEKLLLPDELKENVQRVKEEMELESKSADELVALLKGKSLADLAGKVDQQLMDETLEQTRDWEYSLMQVMNAGFGDKKTNAQKWITGIWKPMDQGFRVEVEVAPGAPEFRLYALLTPFNQTSPQQLLGVQWPGAFSVSTDMKKIEKELTFTRSPSFSLRNKNLPGSLPENIDDLSPECRATMESFGTKLYTSLVFNGLAGGVVGKLTGGIGSLFGATASGIEAAGTAAGWISGGLFDALSPIDRAKFWISFAASSSVSMEPKTILLYLEETVTKGGDKNICLNKPFKLKANWYNECGMKMSGHNSHQFARLVIDRADSAGSRVVGPATGAKGLIGSGAEFAVVGIMPGPAKLRVYVHDKEHYQDMDVNFINCNSPLVKPK